MAVKKKFEDTNDATVKGVTRTIIGHVDTENKRTLNSAIPY